VSRGDGFHIWIHRIRVHKEKQIKSKKSKSSY